MSDCPNLSACGFMKAFGASKSLACQGFVAMFCRGDKQDSCQRKIYKAQTGMPPPDAMMPNGQMITG